MGWGYLSQADTHLTSFIRSVSGSYDEASGLFEQLAIPLVKHRLPCLLAPAGAHRKDEVLVLALNARAHIGPARNFCGQ